MCSPLMAWRCFFVSFQASLHLALAMVTALNRRQAEPLEAWVCFSIRLRIAPNTGHINIDAFHFAAFTFHRFVYTNLRDDFSL